jgi:endonuclease YncB( thermonuclease family)
MPTPTVNFRFDRQLRTSTEKALLGTSDGDTPVIRQPIRMVSVDTPEKKGYAGGPDIAQAKLDRCRERLTSGFYDDFLPESVCSYLATKITADAASRHIDAALAATAKFLEFQEERLEVSSDFGPKVAVIPTGEIVDRYGRMLAYVAPWLKKPLPPRDDPARRTFNLQMIETGWGAFFPIYPSLPQNDDMNRAIAAAEKAWEDKLGQWTFGENLLLAYEYRACIKLAEPLARATKSGEDTQYFYTEDSIQPERDQLLADGWKVSEKTVEDLANNAFQRICTDLQTLAVVGKFDFGDVPPCYRLWVWENDIEEARVALGLH